MISSSSQPPSVCTIISMLRFPPQSAAISAPYLDAVIGSRLPRTRTLPPSLAAASPPTPWHGLFDCKTNCSGEVAIMANRDLGYLAYKVFIGLMLTISLQSRRSFSRLWGCVICPQLEAGNLSFASTCRCEQLNFMLERPHVITRRVQDDGVQWPIVSMRSRLDHDVMKTELPPLHCFDHCFFGGPAEWCRSDIYL